MLVMARTQRVMTLVESRGDQEVYGLIGKGGEGCPSR